MKPSTNLVQKIGTLELLSSDPKLGMYGPRLPGTSLSDLDDTSFPSIEHSIIRCRPSRGWQLEPMWGTTCLIRVYFAGGRGCSCAAESPTARARTVGRIQFPSMGDRIDQKAQWPFLQHRFLLSYQLHYFSLFHTSHVLYST
jgi:hypothetical protein